MTGIIYYWHCVVTNKGYVGQTINTLSGRWKGHVRSALDPKSRTGHWEFPKAIREHGVQNFIGRVLCECLTPEELSSMEDHWMNKLDTLWPNGYNMRNGTNFVCDQTRQLISQRTREAMSKCDPSHKVRQREAMTSLIVRQRISDRTKIAMQRPDVVAKTKAGQDDVWRAKISSTLLGHVISTETREKIRKTFQSKPKKQRLQRSCSRCGNQFDVKKKAQQFCSHVCYWGHAKC